MKKLLLLALVTVAIGTVVITAHPIRSAFATHPSATPTGTSLPTFGLLTITASDNRTGIVGRPMTPITLSAQGGTLAYAYWTITDLPPGLFSYAPSGSNTQRFIAGTPSQAGSYTARVYVEDTGGNSSSQLFEFYIVTVVAPTSTQVPTLTSRCTDAFMRLPINPNRLYTINETCDGDLIRAGGDIGVWIVKIDAGTNTIWRRRLFGPQIFSAYGHLSFSKVKVISPETLGQLPISGLLRREGDTKIYELYDFIPGIYGKISWLPTADDFISRGFIFASVYTINDREFNLYTQ